MRTFDSTPFGVISLLRYSDRNRDITLGFDFTSLLFFCAVSESESSSESVSELEELPDDELLAGAMGPFPFSSESLKQAKNSRN